jgi:hypothetical protein
MIASLGSSGAKRDVRGRAVPVFVGLALFDWRYHATFRRGVPGLDLLQVLRRARTATPL